jgi:hypothetical protein
MSTGASQGKKDASDQKFAVALGGLAGTNAHGAGCLEALRGLKKDEQNTPTLMSCTSGQIYWVYHYLMQREKQDPDYLYGSIREVFQRDVSQAFPFSYIILDDFVHDIMKKFRAWPVQTTQLEFERKRNEYNLVCVPRYQTEMLIIYLENALKNGNLAAFPWLMYARLLDGGIDIWDEYFTQWSRNEDAISTASGRKRDKLYHDSNKPKVAHCELMRNAFDSWSSWFAGLPVNMALHQRDYATLFISLVGIPGKFSVPWLQWCNNLSENVIAALLRVVRSSDERVYLFKEFTNLLPGQLLRPELFVDDTLIGKIAKCFDESKIGILFNSIDLRRGTEHVYYNNAADKELKLSARPVGGSDTRSGPAYRERVCYEPITPAAVRDALWLYFYGLDEDKNTRVDGAYFRQIILSELQCVGRIFVIRPLNYEWIGDFPKTYNDIRDLETELAFNGSYAGERDRLLLINKLINDVKQSAKSHGGPTLVDRFKPIELVEYELDEQRGYYDYMFEDQRVFEKSYEGFARLLKEKGYARELKAKQMVD